MRTYLTNRFQRVKIGSEFSRWLEILLGVPQGSILGPLLFNIFLNDLFLFLTENDICNFADDNTIYSCSSTIEAVICDLEKGLNNSLAWFKTNQLVANPAKFQMMFLGFDANLTLKIGNIIVKPSYSVKLLGIVIDKKLKFDIHMNNVCKIANYKVRCLSRIRRYMNEQQALRLCNAFILCNFNYCPLIWMYCSKGLNKKINTVHKRALRIITGRYADSFEDVLSSLNQLTIHERNTVALLTEIRKCFSGAYPEIVSSLFVSKTLNTAFVIQFCLHCHKLKPSNLVLTLSLSGEFNFGTLYLTGSNFYKTL